MLLTIAPRIVVCSLVPCPTVLSKSAADKHMVPKIACPTTHIIIMVTLISVFEYGSAAVVGTKDIRAPPDQQYKSTHGRGAFVRIWVAAAAYYEMKAVPPKIVPCMDVCSSIKQCCKNISIIRL